MESLGKACARFSRCACGRGSSGVEQFSVRPSALGRGGIASRSTAASRGPSVAERIMRVVFLLRRNYRDNLHADTMLTVLHRTEALLDFDHSSLRLGFAKVNVEPFPNSLPDLAAVEFDELPVQGQSQSRALYLLVRRPPPAGTPRTPLLILRSDSHPPYRSRRSRPYRVDEATRAPRPQALVSPAYALVHAPSPLRGFYPHL